MVNKAHTPEHREAVTVYVLQACIFLGQTFEAGQRLALPPGIADYYVQEAPAWFSKTPPPPPAIDARYLSE